jgi:hypothetical protein
MEAPQRFSECLEPVMAFFPLFQETDVKCIDVITHAGCQDFKGMTVHISVFCFVMSFSLFFVCGLIFYRFQQNA